LKDVTHPSTYMDHGYVYASEGELGWLTDTKVEEGPCGWPRGKNVADLRLVFTDKKPYEFVVYQDEYEIIEE
jgi:hypothetical protein